MTLHRYMHEDLDEMTEDLEIIAKDLNSTRSPCCEKDRFRLWNDEDEARVHRQVIAVQQKMRKISSEISGLIRDRSKVDKE